MTQDNIIVSPNVLACPKPGFTLWSAFQTRQSGDTTRFLVEVEVTRPLFLPASGGPCGSALPFPSRNSCPFRGPLSPSFGNARRSPHASADLHQTRMVWAYSNLFEFQFPRPKIHFSSLCLCVSVVQNLHSPTHPLTLTTNH